MMKNFLNKTKSGISKFAKRCKKECVALAALVAPIMPVAVFAEGEGGGGIDEAGLMENVLSVITKIFTYIGILLLAWSIGMLVLAFKNEDADSKSRAMMMMVVSIILVAIDSILDLVGVKSLISEAE